MTQSVEIIDAQCKDLHCPKQVALHKETYHIAAQCRVCGVHSVVCLTKGHAPRALVACWYCGLTGLAYGSAAEARELLARQAIKEAKDLITTAELAEKREEHGFSGSVQPI